jgi:EmrB/QacA subfamily drug resistance transporter
LPVQPSRSKSLVLALCCLAQFMVVLDVSIVNVALPSIRRDLGFSAVDLQWVVNAYTLTFAGFLLLGGRAADLLGPRRVLIAGLFVFAAASLAGGLSTGQMTLVAARAAQGLGGAVVVPATLSILTTEFAEGTERNRALALWGAMGAVGGSAGALVGGLLTELLGWQWILFVNVPIGAVGAVAATRLLSRAVPERGRQHFDVAGAIAVTTGLVLVTFAIVRTDVHGWTSAPTLLVGGAGLILLVVFVAIEGRLAARPLVPLRVFASRSLTGANLVVFALGSSAFAMWYFLSLYLQQVLGYGALEAGVAFLPMTAAIMVASPVAGRLVSRIGPGAVMTGGMVLIGTGMLLFSGMPADGTFLADVLVPSLLTATGIGFTFVPVTIAAVSGGAREEAGLASGLVNTSRQVGGSLGLAILATLAGSRAAEVAGAGNRLDGEALTAGFDLAFTVGAGFAFAGALAALVLLAVPGRRAPAAVPA